MHTHHAADVDESRQLGAHQPRVLANDDVAADAAQARQAQAQEHRALDHQRAGDGQHARQGRDIVGAFEDDVALVGARGRRVAPLCRTLAEGDGAGAIDAAQAQGPPFVELQAARGLDAVSVCAIDRARPVEIGGQLGARVGTVVIVVIGDRVVVVAHDADAQLDADLQRQRQAGAGDGFADAGAANARETNAREANAREADDAPDPDSDDDVAHPATSSTAGFLRCGHLSYVCDVVDGLLALLGAFPTVGFAGLSVLCVAYWVPVLVGAADLDALDGVAGKAEGAVKGVIEGAADAVAGGVKGGTSAIGEALAALGLSKVPVTITLSMFSLLGLLGAALTRHWLDPVVPGFVSALLATVAGCVVGGVGASALARPLSGMFKDGQDLGGQNLIGKTCRITIDADDAGGQARVDEVIVRVRVVGGRMARDEEAIILDRAEDGVFVVEPLKALMPSQQDAFAQLQHDADRRAASEAASDAAAALHAQSHPELSTKKT